MDNQKDFGDQAVIFKNVKKQEGSNQPDYKAFITINGVKYEAGLWTKNGNAGTFLAGKVIKAGSFVPKDKPRESSKPYEPPQNEHNPMENLPF